MKASFTIRRYILKKKNTQKNANFGTTVENGLPKCYVSLSLEHFQNPQGRVAKHNWNNAPYKVKKNTWTLPYLPLQLLQTLYW